MTLLEGKKWKKNQQRSLIWATGTGTEGSGRGCRRPAAKAGRRFAFKRIGISVTREQQQTAAYAHAPEHWENRNAWSRGS